MAEDKEQTKFEDSCDIDEKQLLRKIDWHLIPGLALLLLLSFLDRINVGNARIEGLVGDLHITGNQYLSTLTIYFVGYVLFDVPCNIALKLTTPRFWLTALTFSWGVVTTFTGVTQNFAGFFAVRFLVGAVESGFIPGLIFYMSMWYKRNERQFRIALLLSTSTLSGSFGGIFAFGIAKMKGIGGLDGWRWIFIMEGLLTIVASVAAYFFIYNYPVTAKFLTPEEKEYVVTRLKNDGDSAQDEKFTWAGVFQAIKDPKVWLYGFCFHTVALPITALGFFLPTIIDELGYTASQAQLLTIPPYVAGFISTMAAAVYSERKKRRAFFIIGNSALAAMGYANLIISRRPMMAYLGTIAAVSGAYPSAVIIASWPANNVSGQTKRATAGAMQLSIGYLGAIVGTQLYRPAWGPSFFFGHVVTVGYLIVNIALVLILRYILKNENARRDRGERDDRFVTADEGESLGDDDPRWRFET